MVGDLSSIASASLPSRRMPGKPWNLDGEQKPEQGARTDQTVWRWTGQEWQSDKPQAKDGDKPEILEDPRMAALPARALVLEYHPRAHGDDPHRSAPALLGEAGFMTEHIFKAASGVGMLWAWRPSG